MRILGTAGAARCAIGAVAAVIFLTACNRSESSIVPAATSSGFWGGNAIQKTRGTPACRTSSGKATCLLLLQSRSGISPNVAGLGPSDFQKAYDLPSSSKGAGQLVAVVDAFDNPKVASDLATYRTYFKLGTAELTKYNVKGERKNYPPANVDWGAEIDNDVEMVSAVCPKCAIDLIEANGDSGTDLEAGVLEAVKLGAHVVSNSWICYGSNACADAQDFQAPGVVYVAAAGDSGYDDNGNPESFGSVVSAGGTVLTKNGSAYSESVWSSSGGGCSSNGGSSGIAKPSWQHDPSCNFRTDTDISAVASNVANYDSYGFGGWFSAGGTSIATPIIAGIFALAGNAATQDVPKSFWTLGGAARRHELHAIGTGSDGSCGGSYLCTAGTKQFKSYAGPTGWGSPNGIGAF
jgi:hypothetical protein